MTFFIEKVYDPESEKAYLLVIRSTSAAAGNNEYLPLEQLYVG